MIKIILSELKNLSKISIPYCTLTISRTMESNAFQYSVIVNYLKAIIVYQFSIQIMNLFIKIVCIIIVRIYFFNNFLPQFRQRKYTRNAYAI